MADGFLGRWSRRKLEVQEGKVVAAEPPAVAPSPAPVVVQAAPAGNPVAAPEPVPQAPPPTLEDAQALTHESDFKPFMARDVAPEVKNVAMKKLFADPHFNVMDRLDTYIDDYSRPDPIPPAMLRQLASAKFLGLFREEEEAEKMAEEAAEKKARDVADNPTAQSVAQSAEPPPAVPPNDDHPDLRLQPDHAAPGPKPGGSA